jgi:hypothetical protein
MKSQEITMKIPCSPHFPSFLVGILTWPGPLLEALAAQIQQRFSADHLRAPHLAQADLGRPYFEWDMTTGIYWTNDLYIYII